jgi:hypothetical protein
MAEYQDDLGNMVEDKKLSVRVFYPQWQSLHEQG